MIPQLQQKMPEGIILGARGVNGLAAYARGGELEELTLTLWNAYMEEHGVFPVQAPFRMWQGLLGLKSAVEKAMAENGGVKPNDEQLAEAMKGLSWPAPSGVRATRFSLSLISFGTPTLIATPPVPSA